MNRAVVARYAGDFSEAESLWVRASEVSREHGDDFGNARALFLRATVAHLRGDFRNARAFVEKAREATDTYERC